jgi:hypothetical protein
MQVLSIRAVGLKWQEMRRVWQEMRRVWQARMLLLLLLLLQLC